jgi:hypothetical protein
MTTHVRLSRIPILGRILRDTLDWIWPTWEEHLDWTLLLERDSFAFFAIASFALVFLVLARQFVGHYGERRLGISRVHLHRQFRQASAMLMGHTR